MDMGMEPELLSPSMQHGEEADFRAEVSRIASDFEKCFRTGAEQQIVEDFLVLHSQCGKLRRKCEDHIGRSASELTNIALSLRERVGLAPHQRFRLVGVGLSNFSDPEDASAQPALFT